LDDRRRPGASDGSLQPPKQKNSIAAVGSAK